MCLSFSSPECYPDFEKAVVTSGNLRSHRGDLEVYPNRYNVSDYVVRNIECMDALLIYLVFVYVFCYMELCIMYNIMWRDLKSKKRNHQVLLSLKCIFLQFNIS